jgi:uncharacterized protein (DUF1501 family)
MDRRYFLKSSGIALAGFGMTAAAPGFLRQFAQAAAGDGFFGKKKVLIAIFQRGAVDGLNMVVPYGETEYYRRRPSIAVPRPESEGGAIDLDGFFGLHPAMAPLEKFWRSQQMAVIHSAGSPDNTRSHFDAQDYMESATPGVKSTRDGWLNRLLQTKTDSQASPFRAVAMTGQTPRSLQGRVPVVAMNGLSDFAIKAGVYTGAVKSGFEDLWQENASGALGDAGRETFEALDFLKRADPARHRPENGAVYPNGPFGRSLLQIAQLIKAGVGLEVAFADTAGLNWDTHANQAAGGTGARGQLANLLRVFGQGLAALATDLGRRLDDVVILTMSEFGRTARQNGTNGTDHGHGNAMLVIGGPVRGGRVYGDWKGLRESDLYEGRDLAVTTDFRDVFAETAEKHLGCKNLEKIFPKYAVRRSNFRGFLA